MVSDTFASLMNFDAPVSWKQKKLSIDEFETAMGTQFRASVRYDTLYFTTDINIKWSPATGEFKFTGHYGKRVTPKY